MSCREDNGGSTRYSGYCDRGDKAGTNKKVSEEATGKGQFLHTTELLAADDEADTVIKMDVQEDFEGIRTPVIAIP